MAAPVVPPEVLAMVAGGGNKGGGVKGAGLSILGNYLAIRQQTKANKELIKYQNAYNTPSNQRKRYEEANMNPNLAYSQGNPGNQSSPGPTVDYQNAFADIGEKIARIGLMKSQTDLTTTKVDESGVKQDLMRSQNALIKANPYMRKEYVDSMVTQLRSIATMKAQESSFMTSTYPDAQGHRWERGFLKMQRELDLLGQKYNLGSADQQIKAQVIESKEFQNSLLEIQKEWMADGDITPQHIYQGIMMLLSKFMSK